MNYSYTLHATPHIISHALYKCRMSHKCQKLKETEGVIVKEKQVYESQLQLLQGTVHEYEALMASKVSWFTVKGYLCTQADIMAPWLICSMFP